MANRPAVTAERQEVARTWVHHAQSRYEKTSNPVFAWEGYLSARSGQIDVPEWVLGYFDRVARRFANMSRQEATPRYKGKERRKSPTVEPRSYNLGPERRREAFRGIYDDDDPVWFTRPNKGKIAPAVYRALEFPARGKKKGPENPFSEIVKAGHGILIASLVYQEQTRNWDAQRKGLEATYDWDTIFANVAASHNQSRCAACKKISKATVKAFWHQHALSVIPAHLQAKYKSKRVADILR